MTHAFIQAKAIVSKLVRAGHIAYFAGGWVRDFIMGHPSEDIDIATNAAPSEIMDLFPQTLLVGLTFGVVIVILEGHQFEVATFRKDLGYKDGRHPEGIEMATPREDALRRDFTINGMFYDPLEEVIHDFVHGQEDIQHGIIRSIGDPHERFFEDRLRILRAFRFSARFSFPIEAETQMAIYEHAGKLFPAVAMERVWQEFNKMTIYPRFDQALIDMHRLKLLPTIFPEIEGLHIKELKSLVKHFSNFPKDCPTILYLMEIFPSLSLEKKVEIAKRLKASNKDIKLIEFVEKLHAIVLKEEKTGQQDLPSWVELFSQKEWEIAIQILGSRLSNEKREEFIKTYEERFEQLLPHIQRAKKGTPLVSSALLQQMGIAPSKQMGLLLKEAEKIAINKNLNDSSSVLALLKQSPLWEKENDSLHITY